MKWSGNNEVGEGSLEIVESDPMKGVKQRLVFAKPFAATCCVAIDMRLEGNQTLVTWSMDGKNDFVGKAMNLLMGMDAMIGPMYEEGLAKLKSLVEKPSE